MAIIELVVLDNVTTPTRRETMIRRQPAHSAFGRRAAIGALALLALMVISGCGNRNGRVQVEGTITIDGQALKHGTVSFYPLVDAPGKNRAIGRLSPDGRFRLSTDKIGDGIDPGSYGVAIFSYKLGPDGTTPTEERAIPKRYFSTDDSGLTAEVTDKSHQVFDFQLTSE